MMRSRRVLKNGSPPTSKADGRCSASVAKAASSSASLLAFKMKTGRPMVCAASFTLFCLLRRWWKARFQERADQGSTWHQVVEQPEPLRLQLIDQQVDAGH